MFSVLPEILGSVLISFDVQACENVKRFHRCISILVTINVFVLDVDGHLTNIINNRLNYVPVWLECLIRDGIEQLRLFRYSCNEALTICGQRSFDGYLVHGPQSQPV